MNMKPETEKRNTSIVETATAVLMIGLILVLGIAGIRHAIRVTSGIRRLYAIHESLFEAAGRVFETRFEDVDQTHLNRIFKENGTGKIFAGGLHREPVQALVTEPEGPDSDIKKVILTVPGKTGNSVEPLVLFIRRSGTRPPRHIDETAPEGKK